MSKRVLFIAYLYPPISNSGTQRPLKFTKYLPSFGWAPIVLTAANVNVHPIDQELVREIPAEASVVRVPMLNERIAEVISTATLGTTIGSRFAESLGWRLREPFKRPDLYALWRPTARHAALKIFREQGFDAIYATGYPWTSLLVGCDVSRVTGRPLIADFRDPWAADDMITMGRLAYDDEFAMERSVVRQATRILTVSEAMTVQMQAAHPNAAAKFTTIQNGFDPCDMDAPAPPPHDKFRFVYTGAWKDNYGPGALYDALEAIKRATPAALDGVEFIAAGYEAGEARRRSLDSHITELGRISHAEAVSLMQSADVLFLPNADGSRQTIALPGKMFEYLATGRPILAMTDPAGEAGQLIRTVTGGEVFRPDNTDRFVQAVAAICREKSLAFPQYNRAALAAFERSSLTKRLASLLDEVTMLPT